MRQTAFSVDLLGAVGKLVRGKRVFTQGCGYVLQNRKPFRVFIGNAFGSGTVILILKHVGTTVSIWNGLKMSAMTPASCPVPMARDAIWFSSFSSIDPT